MQPNPNTTSLSDKNIMTDCLATEKHISNCYNSAVLEAGAPNLRRAFQDILREEQENALRLFTVMSQRGWYQPSFISPQELQQLTNKYQPTQQPF